MSERTATDAPPLATAARRAGAAPTAELLDAVRTEGGRRRRTRHRRRAGFLTAAAVLIVALPVVVLTGGDDQRAGDDVVAASDARPPAADDRADDDADDATAPAERPTRPTTSTTVVAGPVVEAPVTTAPPAADTDEPAPRPSTTVVRPRPTTPTTGAPPPAPTPPTVAPPVCRNSTDPACGAFRFDPNPANAPLTLSATAGSATVAVGQQVAVTTSWSDADAGLYATGVDWGDGVGLAPSFSCSRPAERFGPWDPPPPAGGSGSFTDIHAYDAPGTYTVAVQAISTRSANPTCDDPYRSDASTTLTITVV